MRILILNWRCPRNPRAGGAETFTYEVARRLVNRGHKVEWFSASFPGSPDFEVLEGIDFVRAGRQSTVHFRAFLRYRRTLSGRFDAVLDEVNTIPFLTPLWAGIPCYMLIHQLAREVWWYESPFPLSLFGYLAEPIYLKAYRKTPVLALSESTKADLTKLRFSAPITVVSPGIDSLLGGQADRADLPTFLYVGRISPSKRVDHIIQAFSQFTSLTPRAQLWLAGSGTEDYVRSLHRLAKRLGVEDRIEFLGRLSTDARTQRMAEAHALVMASAREGWGLVVLEANACGTPAIVYNVPGLRDAVRHEQTGLIVAPDARSLGNGMTRLWADGALRERLSVSALRWSTEFSWDRTADRVSEALERGYSERLQTAKAGV